MKIPLLRSASGVTHEWIQEDGGFRLSQTQDTDPIIDHNKALATHNDGYSPTRDLRRVASIPFVLIYKWKNEEGWDAFDPANADKLARKLNDPDYAHLRTAPGQIGISNGVIR